MLKTNCKMFVFSFLFLHLRTTLGFVKEYYSLYDFKLAAVTSMCILLYTLSKCTHKPNPAEQIFMHEKKKKKKKKVLTCTHNDHKIALTQLPTKT